MLSAVRLRVVALLLLSTSVNAQVPHLSKTVEQFVTRSSIENRSQPCAHHRRDRCFGT